MKFTKEELETVGKFIDEYTYYSPPISLSDYLDQCKKPERKKIVVEVEYNDSEFGMSDKAIQESISNFDTRNEYVTKVTELPEVFSREDMIGFIDFYENSRFEGKSYDYETAFKIWLSKRK